MFIVHELIALSRVHTRKSTIPWNDKGISKVVVTTKFTQLKKITHIIGMSCRHIISENHSQCQAFGDRKSQARFIFWEGVWLKNLVKEILKRYFFKERYAHTIFTPSIKTLKYWWSKFYKFDKNYVQNAVFPLSGGSSRYSLLPFGYIATLRKRCNQDWASHRGRKFCWSTIACQLFLDLCMSWRFCWPSPSLNASLIDLYRNRRGGFPLP